MKTDEFLQSVNNVTIELGHISKYTQETNIRDCKECMYDAPYKWCCKEVCMESEFCRNCEAECKEVVNKCPYDDDYDNGVDESIK